MNCNCKPKTEIEPIIFVYYEVKNVRNENENIQYLYVLVNGKFKTTHDIVKDKLLYIVNNKFSDEGKRSLFVDLLSKYPDYVRQLVDTNVFCHEVFQLKIDATFNVVNRVSKRCNIIIYNLGVES